jgi:hypothetical protein
MKIDHAATAEKCRILNLSQLAQRLGVTPQLVSATIAGTYTHMHGEKPQRVLAWLREAGFLVEVEEVVCREQLAA